MHDIWLWVNSAVVSMRMRYAIQERARQFVEELGRQNFPIGSKGVRLHTVNLSEGSDYDLEVVVLLTARSTPEKRRRLPEFGAALTQAIEQLLKDFESRQNPLRCRVAFDLSSRYASEAALTVGPVKVH